MATKNLKSKWTYEDYLLFPDDGKRHELIDGEHCVTPSPRPRHQQISSNLHRIISTFVHEQKVGWVFTAPTDVILSDFNVIQPDLLYISTVRQHIITEKNIQGAPDLVIEILSDTTRKTDEILKRKLYEQYDIAEYWIVDPDLETVKIHRKEQERFAPPIELAREHDDRLTTPLLPGLTIDLAALFE